MDDSIKVAGVLMNVLSKLKAGDRYKEEHKFKIKDLKVDVHGIKSNIIMDLYIEKPSIWINNRIKGLCEIVIQNKSGVNMLAVKIDPRMYEVLSKNKIFIVTPTTDEITITF